MEDKALQKLDELLAHMTACLNEIRQVLPIIVATTPEERARFQAQLRQQVQDATRAHGGGVIQQFMSGRWHRRSGDVYGILTQPEPADADRPPGNLRPTDER